MCPNLFSYLVGLRAGSVWHASHCPVAERTDVLYNAGPSIPMRVTYLKGSENAGNHSRLISMAVSLHFPCTKYMHEKGSTKHEREGEFAFVEWRGGKC